MRAARLREGLLGGLQVLAAVSCAACEHSVVWLGSDHREPPASASTTIDAGATIHVIDAGDAQTPTVPAIAQNPTMSRATPPAPSDAGAADAAISGSASPEPRLPSAKQPCPDMRVGQSSVTFSGLHAQLWVGDKQSDQHGPLLIYWHGTGSTAAEVTTLMPSAAQDIMSGAGVVVALMDSTGTGESVATGTWTLDDLDVADEIVACAIAQRDIDPERIYVAGCDSGGVQAAMMLYLRSHYTAAAMLNSGGLTGMRTLSDPAHVPSVITAHGPMGSDVVIVDYAEISQGLDRDLAMHGGLAVDCPHDAGHCGAPGSLVTAQWNFIKAQRFNAAPVSTHFPSNCQVVKP